MRPQNIVDVQSLSHVQLLVTLWTAARQASLSFNIFQSLLRFKSNKSVMLSNHLILCLSLVILPSIFPAWVFPNELALRIRWPKDWSFIFSPSKKIQGWFPLELTSLISLQSQGLSRDFSSTTVQKHQFFGAQPSLWSNSHIRSLALTIWTFVEKVLSLLFNMLFRFVIAFLPGSKNLWISWFQSPSAVIWKLKKIKYVTASTFPPAICHEVMGPDLSFLNVEF